MSAKSLYLPVGAITAIKLRPYDDPRSAMEVHVTMTELQAKEALAAVVDVLPQGVTIRMLQLSHPRLIKAIAEGAAA